MIRIVLIFLALLALPAAALSQNLTLGEAKLDVAVDHGVSPPKVSVEAKIPFVSGENIHALLLKNGALIEFDLLDGIFGTQEPCWLVTIPAGCFSAKGKVEDFATCGVQLQVVDRDNQTVVFDLTKGLQNLDFKIGGKKGRYRARLDLTFLDIREQAEPCWLPVLIGNEALTLAVGPASGGTIPASAISDYEPGIPNVPPPPVE